MLVTKAQAVTSHAFFFFEGDLLTVAGTGPGGVVAIGQPAGPNVLPDPTDNNWIDFSTIEDWDDKPTEEKKTSIHVGIPGIQVREDIVTTMQALDTEFTTAKLTALAMQIFYRAAQRISSIAPQFVPLSAVPPRGWVMLQRYNNYNEGVFAANLYGRLSVPDGMKGGKGELVMPKFLFEHLYSPMTTAQITA